MLMYLMVLLMVLQVMLSDIITNAENNVTKVLVKFDNDQVGLKTIQSSPHRTTFPNAVPIGKHEVMFFAKQKRGSEITRVASSFIDFSASQQQPS